MPEVATAIRDFANALRATMQAGDESGTSPADRKILQAVVAESGANALHWAQTRVQDGDAVAKPLADLTPALAEGNVVGGGIDAARDRAFGEAKSLANAAVTGTAAPMWVASVVAFLAGVFGFAQDAGVAVGAVVFPFILVGGAGVFAVIRSVATAGPALVKAAGDTAGSAWASAGNIGSRAESIFRQHAGPAISNLAEYGYRPPNVPPVLTQLRGGGKLILGISYAVLAVCLAFFALGISNAYDAYQASCPPQLTLPDGTCIGR